MNNYIYILIFSLLGSLISAFAFAVSSSGKFQIITLTLPSVSKIALFAGIILGVFLSPLMYWAIKDKNLIIVLPILYIMAFSIIILLNYIDTRYGFMGAFIYWFIVLIIMRYFGPIKSAL